MIERLFRRLVFTVDVDDCFIYFILCVCACSDLTMEIVRYRLIGPQSHSVLVDALEAATGCDVRTVLCY